MEDAGIGYVKLGKPTEERHILVEKGDATYQFGIDYLRDVWYSTSYLLDCKQSMNGCAKTFRELQETTFGICIRQIIHRQTFTIRP